MKGPALCSRAGLLSSTLLLLSLGSCGAPAAAEPHEAHGLRQALGLSNDSEVHQINLGGRGAEEHAVPAIIHVRPGDAVEFRTVDHRVHTVTFVMDSLAPAVRGFLETTGQEASTPLVRRGSRFIVRLKDAPPGRYVFVTEGHGGVARGVLEVDPEVSDGSRVP